ncbi:MAG TPA: hypothetical protein VLJ17_23430 [Xanthobacteraceae bacterium]|nr:hypothetical protein [Xanthobacteraceae bacterium]
MRNLFRSEYHKRRGEVEDADGSDPLLRCLSGTAEFREALKLLPAKQCELPILIGASGFPYEEAAQTIQGG